MNKKFLSIFLIIITVFQFTACGKGDNYQTSVTTQSSTIGNITASALDEIKVASGVFVPEDKTELSKKMIEANMGTDVKVLGDTIYYNYSNSQMDCIRYQNINYVQEVGSELGADPLAGASSAGSLFDSVKGWPFFAVDECAMAENNGMPVFIMALYYYSKLGEGRFNTYYEIVSYNTRDNKKTLLYREEEKIWWLALYGDNIFYTTNEGDKGYIIHRINKDGSGHIKMENEKAGVYYIEGIYDDKIYYRKGKNIYSADLELSNSEYICDGYGDVFVKDGYIYYFSPENHGEMCRRDLKTLEEEKGLITGSAIGHYENGIYYYYKDENGKRNNNILYGYVVKTGESFIAFENEGSEKSLMYMGWDKKYLICCISLDGENYSHLAINIQTGEKTLLPY